jgi:CSLREA domain-containing protein
MSMIGKTLVPYKIAYRRPLPFSIACWLVGAAMTAGLADRLTAPAQSAEGSASTLTVSKLADTNDGACDTDCSLREALAVAAPNDAIAFASGLTGTITLSSTLTISKNVVINGPSTKAITISGNNAVRVFYVNSGVNFTIKNLTVANGRIKGKDGAAGINSEAGSAAEGGGLHNNGGSVSIVDCTFSGNRAVGGRGGNCAPGLGSGATGVPGGDSMGGALFNQGTVFLISSTFSDNRAIGGGGGNGYAKGFYGATTQFNGGAGGDGYGGAIYSSSNMWVSNCTLTNNAASGGTGGFAGRGLNGKPGVGSGGAIYRTGGLRIKNSIVANNSSGGNCNDSIASEGYNLDSDGTCGLTATGDLSKTDPRLGPLKNNGGVTFTHALLPASPAIDAGNPAGCTDHKGAALPTDQRGRIRSGRCDIGAFEFSR